MTVSSTLGSVLQSSSEGMANARRTMGQAASSIARFGVSNEQQITGVSTPTMTTGDLTSDILQLSQAATSFKANAAVARIADQAMSEIVSLGTKVDRQV